MMLYEAEFWLAKNASLKAGNFLKSFNPHKVLSEKGRDIKLAADREAEEIIIAELASSQIPILSEEAGEIGAYSDSLRWIIDPLDGTYNFFRGMDYLCCSSIALWDGEKPILGVVNCFQSNEIIAGCTGKGATCNDLPISVSAITELSQACCATGLSVKGDFSEKGLLPMLRIMASMKKIRMLGAAAIMSSYVGCGRIDIYTERDILLWDVAAGLAIAQAAGGYTDIQIKDNYKCDVAAFATKELQEQFHKLMQAH